MGFVPCGVGTQKERGQEVGSCFSPDGELAPALPCSWWEGHVGAEFGQVSGRKGPTPLEDPIIPLAGRFLDEHGQHIHSPSPSYLPFGAGIRVCLGEVLAKMELFLFLAWVLQRFTLECPPDQPLPSLEGKFGVVLQVQKFRVKARLREAWRAAS